MSEITNDDADALSHFLENINFTQVAIARIKEHQAKDPLINSSPKAYSETCQMSKLELFAKTDVWEGFEYISDFDPIRTDKHLRWSVLRKLYRWFTCEKIRPNPGNHNRMSNISANIKLKSLTKSIKNYVLPGQQLL